MTYFTLERDLDSAEKTFQVIYTDSYQFSDVCMFLQTISVSSPQVL